MKTIKWNEYELSKLCLGTVQFGLDYGIANKSGEISQSSVNMILKYVVANEVNSFDTGSMYGNSEEKIGHFFKNQNKLNINIISKIKSDFFILDVDEAVKNISKSLNYLDIPSLFALLLHNCDALKNWTSNNDKLISVLKEQGLISYFGISIYTDKEFNLALKNKNVDVIQIPFNLLDQRAISKNWLVKAKEKNKLIFIRSVYLQGLILMDSNNIPDNLRKAKKYIEIIEEVSSELNITKNELALSFVDQMAKEAILLFGCDNLEQAIENTLNYSNLPELNDETLDYLTDSLSATEEDIYNPTKWNN
ncbi:aldo/keto reductase [Sulfurimonas sp.]|uniref:aldo/keto reductase n=1 Tax=Sulfurimonas sp. TaxID=2022749 RepID=UPI002AB1997B|nr:aldo/keto reductase [Sulfurimonas sp.]